MSTLLGTTSDGRALTYDEVLYEFWLDGEQAAFADVQMLDTRNWLRWRAPQLRDWFRRINPVDLDACNKRARAQRRANAQAAYATGAADSDEAAEARVTRSASEKDAGAANATGDPKADSHLVYRTTNQQVATVNNDGIVHVVGSGSAEIYAHRVNAAGSGPEMRVATVVVDEVKEAQPEVEPTRPAKKSKKTKAAQKAVVLESQEAPQRQEEALPASEQQEAPIPPIEPEIRQGRQTASASAVAPGLQPAVEAAAASAAQPMIREMPKPAAAPEPQLAAQAIAVPAVALEPQSVVQRAPVPAAAPEAQVTPPTASASALSYEASPEQSAVPKQAVAPDTMGRRRPFATWFMH